MSNSFTLNVEKALLSDSILCNKTIRVEDGVIQSIERCPPEVTTKGLLLPGLIDVQVNGGGGYLFNDSPNCETLIKIARAHQKYATTGWLPTFITDSQAKMMLAANAISEAIKDESLGILGVHFEGPFISTEKKGIHAESFIRRFKDSDLAFFQRKDLGQIVITVAPEAISLAQIKALVDSGVIVSLGHSNASFEETMAAFDAGATGSTHLFNAMSQLNSRSPGMVGASLSNKNIYNGLILDGVHVAPASANIAMAISPNMMLVTDAMPPAASTVTSYQYCGEFYQLSGEKLIDKQGRLAGANLTMIKALTNCLDLLGKNLVEAVNMASTNPAKFLNLENNYGELAVGKKASMLMIDDNHQVLSSWVNGYQVV